MASKRRRSKKSKRRWSPPTDYTPFLWILFGLNCIAGLLLSPISSLTMLRVDGVAGFDQVRIQRLAQTLRSRPRFLARSNELRSTVLESSAVESVEYRANFFGRGVLTITYKTPVAIIDKQTGLMLSSNGSVYSSPRVPSGLPIIVPPHPQDQKNLSIISDWRTRDSAIICTSLSSYLPNIAWKIEASKTGFVTLIQGEGGIVELGSLSDSEAKIKALAKILSDDPGLLKKISKLRLYSPQKPVYEP